MIYQTDSGLERKFTVWLRRIDVGGRTEGRFGCHTISGASQYRYLTTGHTEINMEGERDASVWVIYK